MSELKSWQINYDKSINFIIKNGKFPSLLAQTEEKELAIWLSNQIDDIDIIDECKEIKIKSILNYIKKHSKTEISTKIYNDLRKLVTFCESTNRFPEPTEIEYYNIYIMFDSIYKNMPIMLAYHEILYNWEELLMLIEDSNKPPEDINVELDDSKITSEDIKVELDDSKTISETTILTKRNRTSVEKEFGLRKRKRIICYKEDYEGLNTDEETEYEEESKSHSSQTDIEINSINNISPNKHNHKWDQRFNELCEFMQTRKLLPTSTISNLSLYKWYYYNKCKYTAYKKKPNKLWKVRSKKWEKMLEKYKDIFDN